VAEEVSPSEDDLQVLARNCAFVRQVLDCGSPLPLSDLSGGFLSRSSSIVNPFTRYSRSRCVAHSLAKLRAALAANPVADRQNGLQPVMAQAARDLPAALGSNL
jgi:hypothetical protein